MHCSCFVATRHFNCVCFSVQYANGEWERREKGSNLNIRDFNVCVQFAIILWERERGREKEIQKKLLKFVRQWWFFCTHWIQYAHIFSPSLSLFQSISLHWNQLKFDVWIHFKHMMLKTGLNLLEIELYIEHRIPAQTRTCTHQCWGILFTFWQVGICWQLFLYHHKPRHQLRNRFPLKTFRLCGRKLKTVLVVWPKEEDQSSWAINMTQLWQKFNKFQFYKRFCENRSSKLIRSHVSVIWTMNQVIFFWNAHSFDLMSSEKIYAEQKWLGYYPKTECLCVCVQLWYECMQTNEAVSNLCIRIRDCCVEQWKKRRTKLFAQ